jgi:hypothetical protein
VIASAQESHEAESQKRAHDHALIGIGVSLVWSCCLQECMCSWNLILLLVICLVRLMLFCFSFVLLFSPRFDASCSYF